MSFLCAYPTELIFVVSAVDRSVLLASIQAATTVGSLNRHLLKRPTRYCFLRRRLSSTLGAIEEKRVGVNPPSAETPPPLLHFAAAAYVLWLSFHESTLWAEPAMGAATLLECFARSRRARWLPRPLLSARPFQPVRCHPETAPPLWQCTYGRRQGRHRILFLSFCDFAQEVCILICIFLLFLPFTANMCSVEMKAPSIRTYIHT